MQTLLVFGVDRTVGGNLVATLSDRFQVAGVGQYPVEIEGCPTRCADLSTPAQVSRLIDKYSPNWVIYAGSLAGSSWDVPQGDLSREPAIAAELVKAVAEVDARLTYVSTDAVFNGPRMFHREESSTVNAAGSPHAELAAAALAVEQVLQDTPTLLVRTHAYGWSPRVESPEFAENLCQALEDEQPAPISPLRYASPILATDLAELLYQAWQEQLAGTLHIGGAERISSARFARELAAALGLARPICESSSAAAMELSTETSLVSQRARQALSTPMPMLLEGLERFAQQIENGYRDRFQTLQEVAYAA